LRLARELAGGLSTSHHRSAAMKGVDVFGLMKK
jgi:hypothetical protein